MATSGSFQTNSSYDRSIQFDWWINGAQDIANNKTNIGWQLKGSGTASGYIASGNFRVDAGGATRFSSATRISLYQNTVVASGSFDVYHNGTGEGSFDAYAEAGIYQIPVNCTGSGSWVLPQIPRYAIITAFSVASKSLTGVTLNYDVDSGIDYVQCRVNGGAWIDGISISGLQPNTYYYFAIRVKRTDSQLWTTSWDIGCTTYDIARFTSLSNSNFGDNVNVQLSNPSGARVDIDFSIGSVYVAYRAWLSGNNTITFTQEELDNIYANMPNNSPVTLIYRIHTYNGETINWQVSEGKLLTITGNVNTIWSLISSVWKRGKLWINVAGVWRRGLKLINVAGTWKRGK